MEEDRVGVVDDLLKDEVLQLNARGEGNIGSLVARSELRALGDGVVVSAPDELDGIADGSVEGEGDVTEDTLSGSNPDNMSLAGLGGSILGRSQSRELGLALLHAVVEGIDSPVVASRAVGRGRLGLINGCRGTVLRRETLVLAIIGRERSRGTRWRHFFIGPSWRWGFSRSGDHAIAVPGTFDQNGEGRSRSDCKLTIPRYQT